MNGYQQQDMDVPLLKPIEMILLLAVISIKSQVPRDLNQSQKPTNSNITSFVSSTIFWTCINSLIPLSDQTTYEKNTKSSGDS
jgi:hypothetical protein